VLVGIGLLLGVTAAVGQAPQGGSTEKPGPQQTPSAPDGGTVLLGGLKVLDDKKLADTLEAAIAAAQRNHPDVRLAQAKLQVAEAELAQAKLQVAQRVTAAHAKVQAAKAQVAFAEATYRRMQQLRDNKAVAQEMFVEAEHALAQAKATLTAAEAELQAAQGLPPGQHAAKPADATALAEWLGQSVREDHAATAANLLAEVMARRTPPAPGSAADKLRGLVEKRVALDIKTPVPLDQAMTEFVKQAGLTDVTVRYPVWANDRFLKDPPRVGPLVGEQTVAGWMQLIVDDFNRSLAAVGAPPDLQGKYEVYVRDYGLLMTKTDLAPPGAPTLAEFARQAQNEKTLPPVKLNQELKK
jgi:hypothetical protein